jgi:hypothetical protein
VVALHWHPACVLAPPAHCSAPGRPLTRILAPSLDVARTHRRPFLHRRPWPPPALPPDRRLPLTAATLPLRQRSPPARCLAIPAAGARPRSIAASISRARGWI